MIWIVSYFYINLFVFLDLVFSLLSGIVRFFEYILSKNPFIFRKPLLLFSTSEASRTFLWVIKALRLSGRMRSIRHALCILFAEGELSVLKKPLVGLSGPQLVVVMLFIYPLWRSHTL